MTVGNWVLGYVLCLVTIGVGVWHGWWVLIFGGIAFGLLWWYVPDLVHTHQEPPEDTR